MTEIEVIYEGDLHTRCIHGPTGHEIATDAPKDNQGKGETFSPTDLLGAALGSCLLTIMGILAERLGIDLKGAKAKIVKEMIPPPSPRMPKYTVVIHCPSNVSPENQKKLEHAAEHCPVHLSLLPVVVDEIVFRWGGE